MNDLIISGNSCYIKCKCSRWDVQNYNVIIETWLNKSNYEDLRDSVRPGAVGELYNILGRPRYYDKSWRSYNTLWIYPDTTSNSNLKNMRDGNTLIYVKNINSSPVAGASGWINIKIEGMISGQGAL